MSEQCKICAGTQFYYESDCYYCNDCHTQQTPTKEIEQCKICAGTDFYDESDYYYCSDCHTEQPEKKRKRAPSILTTWECWNVVIYNLTQELIKLGANPRLKRIVKCLWIRYLQKLQIIHLRKNQIPKLQLVNNKRDTTVLYGNKRKSNGSSQKELRTTVKFNKYAKKTLRNTTSKKHVKQHEKDINRELKCHLTYRKTPINHTKSPCVLSQGSIYYLLYLGLLINGDEIQLGDLFRFIREGNLTYNSYKQFFPNDMPKGRISLATTQHRCFDQRIFRMRCATMAKFLKIVNYIKPPRLANLCKRYCKELNLPDTIYDCVKILLEKTDPKLTFTRRDLKIPNYEGRAISLIIFTMKLLFGFDDQTEFELSKYAVQLNCLLNNEKMFDVIGWLKFIEYRQLILEEYHFPTQYANRTTIDSDLYLQHLESKNIHIDGSKANIHSNFKKILNSFVKMQSKICVPVEFPASLTPFVDYLKILRTSKLTRKYPKCMRKYLKLDCSKMNTDFLLRPTKYLEIINKKRKVQMVHGGANTNIIIKNIENFTYNQWTEETNAKKLVNLNLYYCSDAANENSCEPIDVTELIEEYNKIHQEQFDCNEEMIKKLSSTVGDFSTNSVEIDTYGIHYNSFERHWMNFHKYVETLKHQLAEKVYKQYPYLFRLLFSECCRIVEQLPKQLMEEYQVTELYLVYVAVFDETDETYDHNAQNSDLNQMIRQAIIQW